MRILNAHKAMTALTICLFLNGLAFSQEGKINIQQDPKIKKLVEVKAEMNKKDDSEKKYKIQIYNGSLEGARKAESEFKASYNGWICDTSFETPNYKVRVGKFKTRLEADRLLIEVKKKYPNAFILIPKQ